MSLQKPSLNRSNKIYIISLSGRKQSGKTELTNICEKYGFKIINFADELKILICEILNISKKNLEIYKDDKNKEYDIQNKIDFISTKLQINKNFLIPLLSRKFSSIRDLLQTIGTDVIRKYNPEWHINQIRKKIKEENNGDINHIKYCFGDCRFKNEKTFIEKELKGECWFIIRPYNFNISNHESEINLRWIDFGNKIIVNNVSKDMLIKRWENYMKTLSKISNIQNIRNLYIQELRQNTIKDLFLKYGHDFFLQCNRFMIQSYINYNDNKGEDNSMSLLFYNFSKINRYLFGMFLKYGFFKICKYNLKYSVSILLQHTERNVIQIFKNLSKMNNPIVYINDKYVIEIHNPYIIENLKLWKWS